MQAVAVIMRDAGMDKPTEMLFDAVALDNLGAIRAALTVGANIQGTDAEGRSPLHIAAIYSSNPKVPRLLAACGDRINGRDAVGRTPLHWAGLVGNQEMIVAFLALGADREIRDATGNFPRVETAVINHGQMLRNPKGDE